MKIVESPCQELVLLSVNKYPNVESFVKAHEYELKLGAPVGFGWAEGVLFHLTSLLPTSDFGERQFLEETKEYSRVCYVIMPDFSETVKVGSTEGYVTNLSCSPFLSELAQYLKVRK